MEEKTENNNTNNNINNENKQNESSSSFLSNVKKEKHLVIMQHGLHGTSLDFKTIRNHFLKQKDLDNCIFISANSNSHFLATHDGIDKIGERLCNEVKELYEQYNHPEKISMIGHSLGGLITRYAIGLLHNEGFFEKCKPDQFISLSSPHCGSRRPSTTIFNKVAHIFVDNFLSVTGKQLILHDTEIPETIKTFPTSSPPPNEKLKSSQTIVNSSVKNETDLSLPLAEAKEPSIYKEVGNNEKLMIIEKKEENEIVTNDQEVPMPLLVRLSEGIFFNGLKMFRKRVLYSNIYNDVQVNFCTSDISAKNPYTQGKLMKFSEKFRHIIEEESILDIDPNLIEQSPKKRQIDEKDIDEYFTHDTHHHFLKKILKNLNQLHFVRYHMYFKNILSHTNIIVKREWINSEGYEIIEHLVSNFEG
ncbi:hypothetical protein RB653_002407 [Dictyostelium firmibasis]|uniref:DUF676 domain-containing protein n=1 Tax=Dictyostelium firmibasis TaxID=79012 RepID=A0AAN7TX70_9MYCE